MTRRSSTTLVRSWYAATAVAVLVGLVVQIVLVAEDDARFGSAAARVANLFTYFTIDSNLLVVVTSALVAAGRARDQTWFRALWVASLLAISITALVFHVVLAPMLPALHGALAVANALVHTVAPLLFVAGWVMLGPRGVFQVRSVAASLLFPLAWLLFTLIRGAVSDYYPYPFLDVAAIGYARGLAHVGLVAVLLLALALALAGIDRARSRRSHRSSSTNSRDP